MTAEEEVPACEAGNEGEAEQAERWVAAGEGVMAGQLGWQREVGKQDRLSPQKPPSEPATVGIRCPWTVSVELGGWLGTWRQMGGWAVRMTRARGRGSGQLPFPTM